MLARSSHRLVCILTLAAAALSSSAAFAAEPTREQLEKELAGCIAKLDSVESQIKQYKLDHEQMRLYILELQRLYRRTHDPVYANAIRVARTELKKIEELIARYEIEAGVLRQRIDEILIKLAELDQPQP